MKLNTYIFFNLFSLFLICASEGQVEIFKINRKSAKCSAGANPHPPQISWQMGDGIIVDGKFWKILWSIL